MQQESRLLIATLRRAITDKASDMPTDVDWEFFYRLTRAHGVSALVWEGIRKDTQVLSAMPAELQQKFSGEYYHAIFRDTQFEHTKVELQERLEEAGVPYVFLKGSRLRYDYPIPSLRTMCDMDILVNTRDYDAITKVAESMGGEAYSGDGNHHNFKFPGGVAVEFHPNLVHPGTMVGTQINPGWQYTQGVEAKELTPEGMYLHTLAHLAEHFISGGVGVKFVLDIWVLRNLSKTQPDRAFVEEELERMDLLEFAQKIEALAEMWFCEGESTPLLEELGEYIISSGSHGKSDRAMLNAVSLSKGGNYFSALWHRVFYPRRELETRYPWCDGKPWLLPAAWCTRAWDTMTKRGHLVRKWAKGTAEVSQEDVRQQRQKMARFGIKRKS